jgi:fructokinase
MDMFPGQAGPNLAGTKSFRPMPGGACANVAVCAARLGTRSAFIGKVGRDAFGQLLADTLKGNGVDITGLSFDSTRRTTLNFHAKPASGGTEYLFYRNPGADANLQLEDVDPAILARAAFLHFDSLSLTDEPARSTIFALLSLARQCGTIVSFDFNYRPDLWAGAKAALHAVRSILHLVDIIKLNEDECAMLLPDAGQEESSAWILEQGPDLVAITRGAGGSLIIGRAGQARIPALAVPVKDTIGCGDAFIAAFLTCAGRQGFEPRQMDEQALWSCGLYADTAASLAATKLGAMEALPRRADVDYTYRKRMDNHDIIS